MARRTSHANLRVPAEVDGLDGEGNDSDTDRPTIKRAPLTVPIVTEPPPSAAEHDGATEHEDLDLMARTRRSMAGFEAARQRAQMERRRSMRKAKQGGPGPSTPAAGKSSHFPAVDEEEEGNTTLLLAEELLNGGKEDDYEAVFMSRPKLKSSPIGTPVREFWD
jgi:hypothetical protein